MRLSNLSKNLEQRLFGGVRVLYVLYTVPLCQFLLFFLSFLASLVLHCLQNIFDFKLFISPLPITLQFVFFLNFTTGNWS